MRNSCGAPGGVDEGVDQRRVFHAARAFHAGADIHRARAGLRDGRRDGARRSPPASSHGPGACQPRSTDQSNGWALPPGRVAPAGPWRPAAARPHPPWPAGRSASVRDAHGAPDLAAEAGPQLSNAGRGATTCNTSSGTAASVSATTSSAGSTNRPTRAGPAWLQTSAAAARRHVARGGGKEDEPDIVGMPMPPRRRPVVRYAADLDGEPVRVSARHGRHGVVPGRPRSPRSRQPSIVRTAVPGRAAGGAAPPPRAPASAPDSRPGVPGGLAQELRPATMAPSTKNSAPAPSTAREAAPPATGPSATGRPDTLLRLDRAKITRNSRNGAAKTSPSIKPSPSRAPRAHVCRRGSPARAAPCPP